VNQNATRFTGLSTFVGASMAPLVTWAWVRSESRVGQARAAARSWPQAVSTAHRGAHARRAADYAAIGRRTPFQPRQRRRRTRVGLCNQQVPEAVRSFAYRAGSPM
jgi:hypothetical protein